MASMKGEVQVDVYKEPLEFGSFPLERLWRLNLHFFVYVAGKLRLRFILSLALGRFSGDGRHAD